MRNTEGLELRCQKEEAPFALSLSPPSHLPPSLSFLMKQVQYNGPEMTPLNTSSPREVQDDQDS